MTTQMLKNLQRTPKPYESLTLFAKDQLVGTVEVVVNEVLHVQMERTFMNRYPNAEDSNSKHADSL